MLALATGDDEGALRDAVLAYVRCADAPAAALVVTIPPPSADHGFASRVAESLMSDPSVAST